MGDEEGPVMLPPNLQGGGDAGGLASESWKGLKEDLSCTSSSMNEKQKRIRDGRNISPKPQAA